MVAQQMINISSSTVKFVKLQERYYYHYPFIIFLNSDKTQFQFFIWHAGTVQHVRKEYETDDLNYHHIEYNTCVYAAYFTLENSKHYYDE